MGALPLIVYNVGSHNSTAVANVHFDAVNTVAKLPVLTGTLDGSALFGFMSGLDSAPDPKPATTLRGRVACWIVARFGTHRRDAMGYACMLSLLFIPWWWRSRATRVIRFSLVFLAVAWLSMAVTRDAAVWVHHTVLLWPFPQLFVAAAFAALPWRRIAIGSIAVLAAINLLSVNQHIADFERYGAVGNFSDAIFGLSKQFRDSDGRRIVACDWGIPYQLAFLQQGRLTTQNGDGPFLTGSPSAAQQNEIEWMFGLQDAVFVTRVAGQELEPKVRPNMDRAAAAAGLHRQVIKLIPDSNGRPIFEIFRFEK
jgi:hypothetical protein